MKLIPRNGNDEVDTPKPLAQKIVNYFKPKGLVLEPCRGNGNFTEFMPECDWCEIKEDVDFFSYHKHPDWIVTNPPYSLMRQFLVHSYEIGAKNIVFLTTTNHILGMKARLKDMKKYGYCVKELILIDTPPEFPASGFQYCVAHLTKGKMTKIKITDWRRE